MIRELLNKHGIRPNRRLGQHFLTDRNQLIKIAEAAHLTKDDIVLEVGTGTGTLTKVLAERAGFVISVEFDKNLIPVAIEYLKDIKNYVIVNEDIMKMNIPAILNKHTGFKNKKVVSNIPYYITTPLISLLLESKVDFDLIVLLIQKEVAERIISKPGIKQYGSFSIFVNYYSEPHIARHIPAAAFRPMPEVDSSVLVLKKLKEPSVKIKDEKLFFRVVRGAFVQRRKMLRNAILNANIPGVDAEKLDSVLIKNGIDGKRRGETLSIEEFAALSNSL